MEASTMVELLEKQDNEVMVRLHILENIVSIQIDQGTSEGLCCILVALLITPSSFVIR
jgi:hypothetical protein